MGVFFQEPNNGGPPGLIRTFQNFISPSSSIKRRTKSHSPILTPPLVRIASHSKAAKSNIFLKPSKSSATKGNLTGSQPISATKPTKAVVFDS